MVIITGGAGFIGSCLLGKITDKYDIIVVDTLGIDKKWKNIRDKRMRDLWSPEEFRQKMRTGIPECEAIIHLGACTSTYEQNMELLLDENYRYSKEIFNFCATNNVKFIYASSAAMYNSSLNEASTEKAKMWARNQYAFSKQLFDHWVATQRTEFQCVGLRFFNVYGPNEYHKGDMVSVINKFYHEIKMNNTVKIYKSYKPGIANGEAMRDFVYVFDVVSVILFFLEHSNISGIFNVGTGAANSYNKIAELVFHELKKEKNICYVDMPDAIKNGYQYYTKASIMKLREVGYTRRFMSIEEGVHDYVCSYLMPNQYY